MRVVAGTLGGRVFNSPHSAGTHPMGDKMRGALFNILGDISGLSVLDAFAGSGALSFEAVSRGANQAVAIEQDRPAQTIIAQNIQALGLGNVQLVKAAAGAWLQTNPAAMFNIVLCDPPYGNLQPNLLAQLAQRTRPEGIFVLSYPSNTEPPTFENLVQIKQQAYGDAQLVFYRAASPQA